MSHDEASDLLGAYALDAVDGNEFTELEEHLETCPRCRAELDSLREFSQRTRVLGYDGKWALTPDQVVVLNEVYSPTQEQFDRAWDILDAYRTATEDDRSGAVMFGDEMIDEASAKIALSFVARGERSGMKPTPK